MDLNDAKILGALCATRHGDPMTVTEIARAAGVSTRATSTRLRSMAYSDIAQQKYPTLQPTWWEITDTGWIVAHKPPNREYIKTREEVTK